MIWEIWVLDHVSELLLLAVLLSPPLDFEWISLASSLLLCSPKFTPPLPKKAKKGSRVVWILDEKGNWCSVPSLEHQSFGRVQWSSGTSGMSLAWSWALTQQMSPPCLPPTLQLSSVSLSLAPGHSIPWCQAEKAALLFPLRSTPGLPSHQSRSNLELLKVTTSFPVLLWLGSCFRSTAPCRGWAFRTPQAFWLKLEEVGPEG